MFYRRDIVRVISTGIIAYVLEVHMHCRELVLLNCKTKEVFAWDISDVGPWPPEGDGGGAVPEIPYLTDEEIEYYLTNYKIFGRSPSLFPKRIRAKNPRFEDISKKIDTICDIVLKYSGQNEYAHV